MSRNQFAYSSRDLMQLVVFSLVVVLGPLLFYPHTLGVAFSMNLGTMLLLEGIYYITVFSVVNSGAGLMATLLGAVIALSYRVALAALFGLMVFAPGAEAWTPAFQQGLTGYWPAFGLFVACSPFVTMSLVKWCVDRLDSQDAASDIGLSGSSGRSNVDAALASRSTLSQSKTDSLSAQYNASQSPSHPSSQSQGQPAQTSSFAAPSSEFAIVGENSDTLSQPAVTNSEDFAFGADSQRDAHERSNGFERGVRYLAEHAGVRIAAVVDRDGFQISGFGRLGFSPENWAPLALTIIESNSGVLSRFNAGAPGRVELDYDNLRIDCRRVGEFYLLVVSEKHSDDLLGVRVSQACEMVNKFISARYSEKVMYSLNSREANMEESDVPSA